MFRFKRWTATGWARAVRGGTAGIVVVLAVFFGFAAPQASATPHSTNTHAAANHDQGGGQAKHGGTKEATGHVPESPSSASAKSVSTAYSSDSKVVQAANEPTASPVAATRGGNGNGNGNGKANGNKSNNAATAPATGVAAASVGPTTPVTASPNPTPIRATTADGLRHLGTPAPVPRPANPSLASAPSKPEARPASSHPTSFPRDLYNVPFQAVGHVWSSSSLRAATSLSIPIVLEVAVAAFLILQAFVDRWDPKLIRAPRRSDHDTVGFD